MAVYLCFLILAVSLVQSQPSGKKAVIMGGSMGSDNYEVWTKLVDWAVSNSYTYLLLCFADTTVE